MKNYDPKSKNLVFFGRCCALPFAILLTWIHVFSSLNAQNNISKPEYIRVKQFSLENGLSQSMVTCLHKDRSGVVWVGTGAGLHYFDGTNFQPVRFEEYPELNIATIRDIQDYRENELLISSGISVGVFNKVDFSFKILYEPKLSEPVNLTQLAPSMWLFWSVDDGFFALYSSAILTLRYKLNSLNERIHEEPKSAFKWKDALFLITTEGFYQCRSNGKIDKLLDAKLAPCSHASQDSILLFSESSVYIFKDLKFKQISDHDWQQVGHACTIDNSELLVSGVMGRQLLKFKANEFTPLVPIVQSGKFADTLTITVKFIQRDFSGNLFIGTDGDGLLVYSPQSFDLDVARIDFVNALAVTRNFLWVGTSHKGLWKLSKDLSEKSKFDAHNMSDQDNVIALGSLNDTTVLVVGREALFAIHEDGSILDSWYPARHVQNLFSKARLIPLGTNAFAAFVLRSEEFQWYADLMLFEFSGNDIRLTRSLRQKYYVNHVLPISENRYLLSTYNGLFQRDSLVAQGFNALIPKKCYATAMRNGCLYVATNQGVLKSHGDDFYELSPIDGSGRKNRMGSYFGMINDGYDNIWFSSNYGIGYVDSLDNFHYLDFSYDYQSLEFCASAFAQSGKYIYFGGINGVNRIDCEMYHVQSAHKNADALHLIQLKFGEESWCRGIPGNGISVELSQNESKLYGSVAVGDITKASATAYSFFLENADKDWSTERNTPDFEYSNLDYGDYVLWVKSKNIFDSWSEPVKLLEIHVPKLYYQTWGFILAVVFCAIFFLVTVVKFVQKRKYQVVIDEMNRQHALDQERLRIARDVHDELGGGLSKMLMISQLLDKRSEDVEKVQALSSDLQKTSRRLLKNLSEVVWSLKSESISLEMFKVKLIDLTNELFLNTEIAFEFQHYGAFEGLVCSKELVKELIPTYKECITNIIKHSGSVKAKIEMHVQNDQLELLIQDFGKGSKNGVSGGNGLKNMAHRIEKCGGIFEFDSSVEKGTTVKIKQLRLDRIS